MAAAPCGRLRDGGTTVPHGRQPFRHSCEPWLFRASARGRSGVGREPGPRARARRAWEFSCLLGKCSGERKRTSTTGTSYTGAEVERERSGGSRDGASDEKRERIRLRPYGRRHRRFVEREREREFTRSASPRREHPPTILQHPRGVSSVVAGSPLQVGNSENSEFSKARGREPHAREYIDASHSGLEQLISGLNLAFTRNLHEKNFGKKHWIPFAPLFQTPFVSNQSITIINMKPLQFSCVVSKIRIAC